MRLINGTIGCVLLAIAVLHLFIPGHVQAAAIYALGAILAVITIRQSMGINTARVLAVITTAAMFFYFAGFFQQVHLFHENWYRSAHALEALGMLLSAFAMIPVLSVYSCVLKADCPQQAQIKRRAFFSAPDQIEDAGVS